MLDYLDFELSDDGEGIYSFDAMAHVTQPRWPALQAEVSQVLQWCGQHFSRQPGALEEGHAWDLDLQLQSDAGHHLAIRWDAAQAQLTAPDAAHCNAVQLSLTISGNEAFAQAFEAAFLTSED